MDQTCGDVGRKLLAGQCLLISIMAIWVVKFLREGYKIREIGQNQHFIFFNDTQFFFNSASNFVSLPWKLGNPCCYNQHLFRIRDLYKEKCSERRRKSHGTTKTRQIADGTHTYIVLNWIWHQKLTKVDLYQFFKFHFSFLLYFCFRHATGA